MTGGTTSVREAWAKASSFLQQAGIEESGRTAEWLIQHVLGWDSTAYWLRWQEPMPAEASIRLSGLLERRAAGEPVQYIIGEQEFYGLAFKVEPAVLIPRPETELLVERLLGDAERLAAAGLLGESAVVADIGTGSGAIPVTLAVKRPAWRLAAVDISPEALRVAGRNAERHKVAARVEFLQGDLLAPLEAMGIEPDLLVSNPPYIPTGDLSGLQREVRDFEPRGALDGGADGLDFYRRLAEGVTRWTRPPRWIGLEVGQGQAEAVSGMLRESGLWPQVETVEDWNGIGRHVIGMNFS